MSTCDVCMRDVDDGVACGDCQYPDPDEHIRVVTERDDWRARAEAYEHDFGRKVGRAVYDADTNDMDDNKGVDIKAIVDAVLEGK